MATRYPARQEPDHGPRDDFANALRLRWARTKIHGTETMPTVEYGFWNLGYGVVHVTTPLQASRENGPSMEDTKVQLAHPEKRESWS